MAIPLDDLSERSDAKLHVLIDLIESQGLEERSLGEAYLDRRSADVLAHLHGWHLLFEDWLREEAAGEDVVMPAPGHTWDNLRALNDDLYERYRAISYGEIKDLVLTSHAGTFVLLRALPTDGLTDPAAHPWSNEPLLSLADECTGKHYDWGIERIDAYLGLAEQRHE
jgi:hypothetical protein